MGTAPLGGGQFRHLSHSLDSTVDSPYPSLLIEKVEFTRFSGDPKYEGEPINYAAATGLRLPGAEGDRN
jgi:hypothetical protein